MHSITLLVAMTATTGLFGNRYQAQTCTSGTCGAVTYSAPTTYARPVAYQAPARVAYRPAQPAAATYSSYYYTPQAPAQVFRSMPATAPAAAPAPATYTRPAVAAPAYYSYPAAATTCPNGNCYRR